MLAYMKWQFLEYLERLRLLFSHLDKWGILCWASKAHTYIVACHLPRGSNVRLREDMSGGLPRARVFRAMARASNLRETHRILQLIPIHSHDPETPGPFIYHYIWHCGPRQYKGVTINNRGGPNWEKDHSPGKKYQNKFGEASVREKNLFLIFPLPPPDH